MAPPADTLDAGDSRATLWPSVAKAILLLAGLVGAALLLRRTGTGLLQAVHPTWAGAALLIGAGGAMTAAGLPRQAIAFAGGYAFGAPAGAALSLVAQVFGCVLDYAAARGLAGGLTARLLAQPTARRLTRFLTRHPFTATLTLRLLPVSSNMMLNLVAGASRLDLTAFLAATILGYLPQTVIFALLGGGTQVGRGAQLLLGVGLFAVALIMGMVLLRRVRKAGEA